jgi:hypothetical protein
MSVISRPRQVSAHNRTHAEAPTTLVEDAPRTLSLVDQVGFWGNLGVSLLGFAGAIAILARSGVEPLSVTAAVLATIAGPSSNSSPSPPACSRSPTSKCRAGSAQSPLFSSPPHSPSGRSAGSGRCDAMCPYSYWPLLWCLPSVYCVIRSRRCPVPGKGSGSPSTRRSR